MADEQKDEQSNEQKEEEKPERGGGQKIMCFVSKEMVPINETVELEYMPGKKVRVLPRFIKFEREEETL